MVLTFPTHNLTIGQVYELWTWDGEKWICSGGSGGGGKMPVTTQVFTVSGTYTPSHGITSAVVECVGGGGGGGEIGENVIDTGGGGGGGSGGYSRSVLSSAQIGTSQPVAIGVGGATQANGGTTSFGSLVTALGGQGGGTFNPAGSAFGPPGRGAAPGTGNIALRGNDGGWGNYTPIQPPAAIAMGGAGAPSALGGGTYGPIVSGNQAANGTDAGGYGAGGTGAATNTMASGGTFLPGGAGSSGICIVTEYS